MDIIYLIGAGLAEVGLVFCMKRAGGFKQLFWTVGTLFCGGKFDGAVICDEDAGCWSSLQYLGLIW